MKLEQIVNYLLYNAGIFQVLYQCSAYLKNEKYSLVQHFHPQSSFIYSTLLLLCNTKIKLLTVLRDRHAFFSFAWKTVCVSGRSSCEYWRVCLYLVSDVVLLIFLRHSMDLKMDPRCGACRSLRGRGSNGAFSVSRWGCTELIPQPGRRVSLVVSVRCEEHILFFTTYIQRNTRERLKKKSVCTLNDLWSINKKNRMEHSKTGIEPRENCVS